MTRAVLVTHRQLGSELVRTVESILGPQGGVVFVSNAGASLEELQHRVREAIGRELSSPAVAARPGGGPEGATPPGDGTAAAGATAAPEPTAAADAAARGGAAGPAGAKDAGASGEGAPSIFLFVDILGGSCGQICRALKKARPGIVLFSGVNLPMLIEFFYNRDRVPEPELVERILRKGREGILNP